MGNTKKKDETEKEKKPKEPSIKFEQLTLDDEALENQLKGIVKFLEIVHPCLLEEKNNLCVELRPINRQGDDFLLKKSLTLWNLNETSQSFLRGFLRKHNGYAYCLYYSVYAFDKHQISYTKKGKIAQPGKITIEAARHTEVVVLDFDKINHETYLKYKNKFEKIGLMGIWIFSGHGYQFIIRLSEKIYKENMLAIITTLAASKGFEVDRGCKDSARVMRLPQTFNCKAFGGKFFEIYPQDRVNPPFTRGVGKLPREKYKLNKVIEILDSLETVDTEAYEEFKKELVKKQDDPIEQLQLEDDKNVGNFLDTNLEKTVISKKKHIKDMELHEFEQIEYPCIDITTFPLPIQKMLYKTPIGFRNATFAFLMKFFKQYQGCNHKYLKEILEIWANKACVVPYTEFYSDYERIYSGGGIAYSKELANEFGYIDFNNYISVFVKRDIIIPNELFDELDKMTGSSLKVYLLTRMYNHENRNVTITELSEYFKLDYRTINKELSTLSRIGYIYKIKNNRVKNEKYEYVTSEYYSVSKGFMKLSYGDLKMYLDELTTNELKVYLYMLKECYRNKFCTISQKNMAKELGVNQSSVSRITSNLNKKHYVEKNTKIERGARGFCSYNLLK